MWSALHRARPARSRNATALRLDMAARPEVEQHEAEQNRAGHGQAQAQASPQQIGRPADRRPPEGEGQHGTAQNEEDIDGGIAIGQQGQRRADEHMLPAGERWRRDLGRGQKGGDVMQQKDLHRRKAAQPFERRDLAGGYRDGGRNGDARGRVRDRACRRRRFGRHLDCRGPDPIWQSPPKGRALRKVVRIRGWLVESRRPFQLLIGWRASPRLCAWRQRRCAAACGRS